MKENIFPYIPQEFLNPSEAFKGALKAMEMHWWYWDHVNKHLHISDAFRELLGYSEEEFDPRKPTIEKNIHDSDLRVNLDKLTKMLYGELDDYEMEYRLKVNGEWCWYYNRGSVILKDKEGKGTFIGGITMNLSKRFTRMLSRAEEASKFDFVFRNTSDAIIVGQINKDQTTTITQVNDACGQLFGMDSEMMKGLDAFEVFGDASGVDKGKYTEILRDKGLMEQKYSFHTKQGEKRYIELEARIMAFEGEELFIAAMKDVTESHQVREELKASEKALRESENIYRTLIQAANDRIAIMNMKGKPLIVNEAFTKCLGYDQEEYMSNDQPEEVHPEDRPVLEMKRKELMEKGTAHSEYRVKHRDGHYLSMSSKSVLLDDPELDQAYVLFIIRDVTDAKENENELIKAKEKAIESDRLKSAFLANMSHEIRTPMNSIIGFSSLLADNDLSAESRQEYVDRISRNSSQLLALISDIIDLAKIESNQLTITHSKVILESLFQDLMNYGEMQLQNRKKSNLKLSYCPDEKYRNIEIETDLLRLTQILQNLLNNAVKFTESGEIKLGYEVLGDKIIFFVKDSGIGIAGKDFSLIFDQFRQVDGSHTRKFGGTGLGLAICKNLAGLLGGAIRVESEMAKGSTFYLEIPIVSTYRYVEGEVSNDEKAISSEEACSVLMVDDDPDSNMLIASILRKEGFEVITAESGYRALEILERGIEFNVVLMDLQMPVLSGEQTMKLIKNMYPKQRVVAQSAHALQGYKERAIEAGFDGYISKPYSKRELIEVITR